MKAIEFTQEGTAFVRDVPKPIAGSGEAVVRVTSAGVCGSDISSLHGTHPFRKPPLISGHEVGGVIDHIHPNATSDLRTGERVVIDPQWPCQACGLCNHGDYHLCTHKKMLGVRAWPGGLADYVKVPAFTLVRAPDELDASLLSFAEPVAVAVHAVRRAGSLDRARTALILGGGTIGTLISAVLSKHRPEVKIVVAEPRESMHDLLALAGASAIVTDATQLPRNAFDVVFLAAGVSDLVNIAIARAVTGGTVVQVALFKDLQPTPIGDLQIREISLIGTATYTKKDIADALDVIRVKPELIERMVTFTDDWGDAAEKITTMASEGPGEIMKLIVNRSSHNDLIV